MNINQYRQSISSQASEGDTRQNETTNDRSKTIEHPRRPGFYWILTEMGGIPTLTIAEYIHHKYPRPDGSIYAEWTKWYPCGLDMGLDDDDIIEVVVGPLVPPNPKNINFIYDHLTQ